MRKASLYSLILFVYLSCKKEENIIVTPAPATTIQLEIDQVINDSSIVLKWSKFTGNNFSKYQLVRYATYLKNGQFGSFAETIDSSNDVDHVSFVETNMPLAVDISYYINVIDHSMNIQANNRVYYQRPNSLIDGIPKDVLFDPQQQKLYVTQENKIMRVDDSNGRIINSKEYPSGIGFCYLGSFNGARELYVPVDDGWLEILDGATLQLKDRIYVGGYAVGSVAAVNSKLYVASSDMSQGAYSNCIKVYDRATKNLEGRTGYWERTRLIPLEGTNVEMIDLTSNLIPVDLCYFEFTPSGTPVSKKQDPYHGDYSLDANIVRSFPDGSKLITSGSGTIFHKSLVFDRYIKQYGNYSDFAFNDDGSLIYAAVGPEKKIDVVSYPSTTTISSYPTNFYPYKIFRKDNTLICVGKAYIHQQMNYLFIEKINL